MGHSKETGKSGRRICHSAPLHGTRTFPTPPLTAAKLTLLRIQPKTLILFAN